MTDAAARPDLAELRDLLAKATPGPWAAEEWGPDATVLRPDGSRMIVGDALYHPESMRDAALIVAMRNALPALLSEIERRGDDLGAAWREAEAALPEGWRPITVGPPDPDAYDVAGNAVSEPWYAATVSPAFFNGETENDAEWACGYGPTPAAALLALAAALTEGSR